MRASAEFQSSTRNSTKSSPKGRAKRSNTPKPDAKPNPPQSSTSTLTISASPSPSPSPPPLQSPKPDGSQRAASARLPDRLALESRAANPKLPAVAPKPPAAAPEAPAVVRVATAKRKVWPCPRTPNIHKFINHNSKLRTPNNRSLDLCTQAAKPTAVCSIPNPEIRTPHLNSTLQQATGYQFVALLSRCSRV